MILANEQKRVFSAASSEKSTKNTKLGRKNLFAIIISKYTEPIRSWGKLKLQWIISSMLPIPFIIDLWEVEGEDI